MGLKSIKFRYLSAIDEDSKEYIVSAYKDKIVIWKLDELDGYGMNND